MVYILFHFTFSVIMSIIISMGASVTFENVPVALPTADLGRQVPLDEVIVTKKT